MSKTFNYAEAEPRLYAEWEKGGYFKPEIAGPDAKPFVIAIPPPNVTGELHVGHALFVSLEDLMTRYERMRGKAVLWIPGTDHAGIATQLQVEKMLRSEGTSREEVGREEFLFRTWEWKKKYGGAIENQLRRLGASVDWDRLRFTLDETLSAAVREAFITLWEQGLIYRGPRLINWSPGLQTAVSDLEVERSEEEATLYFFKYPVEGGEHIPVATTRPETILGDTAVAVHPEDDRYKHLIGKTAYVPFINRPIPVIADESVDREFGTGALKITPAHDFNDYEVAQRHNLPMISIMRKDASLNENGGPYAGMDRYAAREKLWANMKALGLTIKTQQFTHVVPRTQRGGEIVEPILSVQWFVKIQPLAEKAIAAVKDGQIKIVPERFEKTYFNWLENIRDWCISRQLWWGHRIPAFYCEKGHITVDRQGPTKCATCGSRNIHQDEDVLDTWFSSGLWPFSTLGWPQETPDLKRFYPTDVLETGYDILFFWVARMIMMGLWFTDKPPFHTVYLHGLVLDEHGNKMSKTKGNVTDPLEMMDRYGTDALRFTLLTGGTPGNDQNISEAKIEFSRNFGNKLWQISKFVLSNLGDDFAASRDDLTATERLPDRWILSRLNGLVANVQRLFDTYQYGEAGRQIQDFVWSEFADWYIEISKNALYGGSEEQKSTTRGILLHVLETCLKLLHPFMPYVTEEIWSHLPGEGKRLVINAWPVANPILSVPAYEERMDLLRDLVVKVRNVRVEYDVEPAKHIRGVAVGGSAQLVEQYADIFARLCNVEQITATQTPPNQSAVIVSGDVTLYLPLADMVNLAAERERLSKEMSEVAAQIERVQKTLGNENFVSRAKPEVVARERARLAELTQTRETLEARLDALPPA
ncbi:MAG: valine--tRNA ligase [Aggregatilineales bacterium]